MDDPAIEEVTPVVGSSDAEVPQTSTETAVEPSSPEIRCFSNDYEQEEQGDLNDVASGCHSGDITSPVPVFFTATQVSELLVAVIEAIGPMGVAKKNGELLKLDALSILSNQKPNIDLSTFLTQCPVFAEGDYRELQHTTFEALSSFLSTHLVLARQDVREQLFPPTSAVVDGTASATVGGDHGVDPVAESAIATVPSATQKVPVVRVAGSAPPRRDPIVAGVIAKSKPSLFRPQTAGIGHQVALNVGEALPPPNLAQEATSSQGGSQGAIRSPRASTMPILQSGDELAVQTFHEIERHLKDDTGKSRFASTEYTVEAVRDDRTVTDRRSKSVALREKDNALLHNLEPHRRNFMIQYFADPDMVEKRRKRVLAEEFLKQARQSKAAQSTLGRAASAALMRSVHPAVSHGDEASAIHAVPDDAAAHVQEKETKWNGAKNEGEVWNAVRTRPASANATLPLETVTNATSEVAKKYLRLTPAVSPQLSAIQGSERQLTFAEMVARRRDVILAESRKDGQAIQPQGSEGGDASARKSSPVTNKQGTSPPRSTNAVVIINPGEGGLYKKRSHLAQALDIAALSPYDNGNASSGRNSPLRLSTPLYNNHGSTTTITTAAYLPMTHADAPSSMLRSPSAEKKYSKYRSRLDSAKSKSQQTAVASIKSPPPLVSEEKKKTTVRTIPTGTFGASSSAASVAAAAAKRVGKLAPTSPERSPRPITVELLPSA